MHKKRIEFIIRCVLCCFAGLSVDAFADVKSEPWTLRDHYNISGESVTFQLDPKRAEWRVVTDRADTTMESAYAEIELGNGRRVRLSKSNWITDGRDTFTDGFGKGMRFRSEFKPIDGLHVEYHLNRYDAQAFMTMMIIVRNTGVEPISIKAIRHGVVESGALARAGAGELVLNRGARRGIHTVLQDDGQINLAGIRVDGTTGLFGMGLLQSGYMESTINISKSGAELSGVIESVYSPAIQMMPGGTAQSDLLWFLLSAPDAKSLSNVHVYSESSVLQYGGDMVYPNGWMTVTDEASHSDLLEAATAWNVRSINHALVPGGWQSGATKDVMDMGNLAKSLRNVGMTPGLSVDPLRSSRAIQDVTLEASDGSYWLDISKPEARAYGAKSLSQLARWKYDFFVVDLTRMPDDVLRKLNITRSVADRVSFELLYAAVGSRPILPSTGLTIGNDLEGWNAAARTTDLNPSYSVLTGPVRLDVSGVNALSDEVTASIGRFRGPVEIVGTPGKKVRQQLTVSIPAYYVE